MKCLAITLSHFRNIENERCEFADGVNVLWGRNAQGKSNMLESVYFFARGRSFRGAREKEMIAFQKKCATMSLDCIRDGDTRPVTLSAELPAAGRKTLYRGGAKLTGIKEMIGSFRAVLFCPAHLTLIDGGPALRRSFLDIALSQLYPAYIDSLSRYNRALLQRNSLIKKAAVEKVDPSLWEIYADQLSFFGSDIAQRRAKYAAAIESFVAEIFGEMTDGRETPTLSYRSVMCGADGDGNGNGNREIDKKRLYDALISDIDREIRYGATLFGIHKDDIVIKLNGRDSKLYASQGQKRSLALSMKLAEGEASRSVTGEYPVFLLDDVLSELDGERRSFILSKLRSRQIIVTSCEPDIYAGNGGADRLIHIDSGKIVEVHG